VKRALLPVLAAVALGSVARASAAGADATTTNPPLGAPATPIAGQSAPEESNPSDNATDNARLAAVLPRGMSSQEACRGFTSLDLCAATLHAAQNLNIPFADLKRQLAAGQGLGAAIHTVKPSADANAEATRAKAQAQQDMRAPHG
jgi:hypothetical protein